MHDGSVYGNGTLDCFRAAIGLRLLPFACSPPMLVGCIVELELCFRWLSQGAGLQLGKVRPHFAFVCLRQVPNGVFRGSVYTRPSGFRRPSGPRHVSPWFRIVLGLRLAYSAIVRRSVALHGTFRQSPVLHITAFFPMAFSFELPWSKFCQGAFEASEASAILKAY